jgi:hypothetical protein
MRNDACQPGWQHSSTGWQPLNLLQQQISRGSLRVGDEEREAAARALGDHFASGRLDREEYDERLELAFAARTGSDLAALFRDLPQTRAASPFSHAAQDAAARRRSRRGRIPFLPVLLILIGVSVVFHAAWIIWVGLGVMLLAKKFQWERRHRQRSTAAWT